MLMCAFVFGGASGPIRKLDGDMRPFEIFSSVEELDDYRASHKGDFFNLTDEEYGKYDENFFREYALVMFLTEGMSGSIRCAAENYRVENSALYVRVKEFSPPMHTMDLRYNTLAVAVPRGIAKNIAAVYIEAYRVDVRQPL